LLVPQECREALKKEMKGLRADVVLCDGAPNVGAAYKKDAFVQNEIALAALRVATHHLGRGGTFLTKVYRSQDYNALMWVFNQLFEKVQAIKPSSSRQQSAEIFVLCLKYRDPHSIDPKLLDPAYVFEEVVDDRAKINIFHQQYAKQKRHRGGYEAGVGVLLHRKATVSDFIESEDPVQMLTDLNQLVWGDKCKVYADHALTTGELKLCMEDLRVLGKSDFKALLKWRLKLREEDEKRKKAEAGEAPAEGDKPAPAPKTEEEEEQEIQEEIMSLRDQQLAKKKRALKKERERTAKLRTRQAYGMHHQAFDLPEHDSIFSLKDIKDQDQLDVVRRGDYVEVAEHDGELGMPLQHDASDSEAEGEDETGNAKLEEELEEAYQSYLSNKSERLKGTRAGKRKQSAVDMLASEKLAEDAALYDGDLAGYVNLLTQDLAKGKKGVDDDDADDYDSSDDDEEEMGEGSMDEASEDEDGAEVLEGTGSADEHGEAGTPTTRRQGKHPLLIQPDEGAVRPSARVARWFSNPVFSSAGVDVDEEDEEDEALEAEAEMLMRNKKRPLSDDSEDDDADDKKRPEGLSAEDVIASLPKTDKQVRQEKRKKERDRRERRAAKKLKAGTASTAVGAADMDGEGDLEEADEQTKARRALIRAGMGAGLDGLTIDGADDGFEVVPQEGGPSESLLPPVKDERKYDSDHEDYDDGDRAATLAIGTMMLRRSKAKQLVDASYNRFAWNDAGDLPEWFVDDESKNYRPQVPIPKVLMDEMKERFKSLASKPIKKVAEARARKKKRALQKLKQAKTKAAAIASNPDMTERDKIKAIAKACKGKGEVSRPGKVYAVIKKGGSSMATGKGKNKAPGNAKVKFVDKRLKKDTRSMKAKNKRGAKGGKGGKKKARASKKR
jgi:AdoMet-dependent rRNA methyltransferase SPB1